MPIFIQALCGCFIFFVEMLFILYFLDEELCAEEWTWFIYSICMLVLNLVPAIVIDYGKPLFFVSTAKTIFVNSTILSIISIIILGISFIINGIDVYESANHVFGGSAIFSIILVAVVTIAGASRGSNIVEVGKRDYTEYYNIYCDNEGTPSISYVTGKENENGYYVVLYESKNESGETKLNVLNISPLNTDIVFATEEQDKDYLIIYTTEHVKENKDQDPPEEIIEKSYSYKLVVRKGFPIINIIPDIN